MVIKPIKNKVTVSDNKTNGKNSVSIIREKIYANKF